MRTKKLKTEAKEMLMVSKEISRLIKELKACEDDNKAFDLLWEIARQGKNLTYYTNESIKKMGMHCLRRD